MAKERLDKALVARGLVPTRSQAESYIRLGKIMLNGRAERKTGTLVGPDDRITLQAGEQYVGRAGLKLAGAAASLGLDFTGRSVLDVGSSTGGFTQYALRHGARRVYAVDVGTDQLHPSLRSDPRIVLHEKTDIRQVATSASAHSGTVIIEVPDMVLIDVSFISLREVLPHIASLSSRQTQIVAMVKPQFEAGRQQVTKGVIKNDRVRRDILGQFEVWAKSRFVIKAKADSQVAGSKGNRERFYVLQTL